MAELNVKKKRKSPVGWIILGLVVIALIVWIVVDNNDNEVMTSENNEQIMEPNQDEGAMTPGENDAENSDMDAKVQEFVSFVNGTDSISMDHEVTHEGITKLTEALAAVTPDGVPDDNVKNDVDALKQEANQLLDNRLSEQHANIMRNSFISAAKIIENIQKDNYPDLDEEANQVMEAAEDIDAQQLATNQKEDIKSFFDEAADALQKMEAEGQTASRQ